VMVAPTTAGSIMIALLTAGVPNNILILGTLAGFVVALPVAWILSRSIRNAVKA